MGIFISHSTEDSREAHLLKELLEAQGFEVFLAPDSLRPADDWRLLVREAVHRCEVVVVLDSPASRTSPWVQQEAGIAMATGAIVIPIALHASPSDLPGWLGGLQAIVGDRFLGFKSRAEHIAHAVVERAALETARLPEELRAPRTVGAFVLRVLQHDQFSAPAQRRGAWSRQYDRYLFNYYGTEPSRTVSQGATLTFTGMNVARLKEFVSAPSEANRGHGIALMQPTIHFVLASRDPDEGGFGRQVDAFKSRGGHGVELDPRHTCWALSILLDLDPERYREEISAGYAWLLARLAGAYDKDRWCWTSAAVIKALLDPRCPVAAPLREPGLADAVRSLEAAWDPGHGSWVAEEAPETRSLVAVDNALYVLECIAPYRSTSATLERQCAEAVDQLVGRCVPVGSGRAGLALFGAPRPEAGATAQLVRIMDQMGRAGTGGLADFVVGAISGNQALPLTFSWHLAAALTVPALAQREIVGGEG